MPHESVISVQLEMLRRRWRAEQIILAGARSLARDAELSDRAKEAVRKSRARLERLGRKAEADSRASEG